MVVYELPEKDIYMSMRNFIKEHKAEIDNFIRKYGTFTDSINNSEREQWILNSEYLYRWAKAYGVKI